MNRGVLELVGGPHDGQRYGNPMPWPVRGPAGTPIRDLVGRDLAGYGPARHNGHHWVSHWLYPRGPQRRRWCVEGCDTDHCPNYAPPPPAGGAA